MTRWLSRWSSGPKLWTGTPHGRAITRTGVHYQSSGPYDKLDIKRVTDTCSDYYQTCQESWHPNAAGHQVLGRCLSGAWSGGAARVTCVRTASGDVLVR